MCSSTWWDGKSVSISQATTIPTKKIPVLSHSPGLSPYTPTRDWEACGRISINDTYSITPAEKPSPRERTDKFSRLMTNARSPPTEVAAPAKKLKNNATSTVCSIGIL